MNTIYVVEAERPERAWLPGSAAFGSEESAYAYAAYLESIFRSASIRVASMPLNGEPSDEA